ncbi:MAG: hypothetical protein H8D23_22020 [Candidatus Brocadiales bacterium]|nr:hypothetical protein [Candidatus Brocadiales bacterium]
MGKGSKMKYAKLHYNKDAQVDTVGGGNLETDIPENVSGGVASLDTMPTIPDDFEGSELATMGRGPSGLENIDDLMPATPAEPNPKGVETPEGGNDPDKEVRDAAYWQSKHDKQEYQHQLDMANLKVEILAEVVGNKNEPALTPEPELKAPVRPANFDAFEAYNNPDSESYQWREADADYRAQAMVQAVRQEFSQKDQERDAITQRAQSIQRIEAQATQLAGNDPTKAKDFIAFLNSPKSYDLGFMYQAFQASKSNVNVPPPALQNFQKNLENQNQPPDPGQVHAEAPRVLNEQDQFNEGRKRNLQRATY